ncbi:T9SS type A sorting domain-containing protein [Chitinophaga qingshengii]|uniref:T9SS type A sorting domain-containing protein n=1 Tax=Chitinophaga qingshengii TaxID=1569794 RepID=A0ABR7TGD7_9BACT|nr:T9SS type A sorting domain-containing protein [Chitinophaga qingshengii]MBC9928983.1 T9SS type A sorting domain-containing protein [Chitinophaga qingshengii]
MKQLLLFIMLLTAAAVAEAQTIPPGSCGVMFYYDGAGNRVKRQYICNNTARMAAAPLPASETTIKTEAMYPNPTTGPVTVIFAEPLKGANITLLNISGKTIRYLVEESTRLQLDLSDQPDGIYFIHVVKDGKPYTRKIVKTGTAGDHTY